MASGKMYRSRLISLIAASALLMACAVHAEAPLPVIPGAAGFGMETPAGSGRHLDQPTTRVIKVTNLKTDGPGSLARALRANGPRVIVFEVAGEIDYRPYGSIGISNPYVTVAGQTAPSPGITLLGCQLGIGTHDVLLQHIRIRVGDLRDPKSPITTGEAGWTQWSERDCMKVSGERIVIDHCSFSWATDELVQTRARHITFRQNLFSECLDSPKHHKGTHSKALLILDQSPQETVVPEEQRESRYVAVIGNLFAFNADRHPAASGGAKILVANNFVYGVLQKPGIGITLSQGPQQGSRGGPIWATVTANHFDRVPYAIRVIARRGVVGKMYLGELLYTCTDKNGKAVTELHEDPWTAPHMKIFKEWVGQRVFPLQSKVDTPPVLVPGLKIKPVREVREWTLGNAGARPADRDTTDRRVVELVRNRKGKILKSQMETPEWQAANTMPDAGQFVAGEPPPAADVSMPELREGYRKLTPPANPNADDDGDGYTNLEEWLHGFAAEVEGRSH